MATTLASLVVKIGADVTGVTAGLTTLEKRTRKIKKEFSSVTDSTLRLRDAMGVLAGATGLAFVMQKTFDVGAAVEETASKFRTVFGPAVDQSEAFLREFANTAGLTVTQGRELVSTTGAITQGLGFSQQASADLSEQIVRMAADIASFNNTQGGAERVTQAMISALNGETESLKASANVVVLQADVMAKAAEMTGKATGEITRQDKALATLALISERAGVAMGDLGRTMDSPANQARRIRAEFLTFRDDVAHALLPALTVIMQEIGMLSGSEGFAGLGEAISQNSQRIAAWAKFAVETFKTVALAMAAPIRIAFNLGEVIGKVLVASVQALKGDFEAARETMGSILGDFGDIGAAVSAVTDGFDNMRVASGLAWQTMAGPGGADQAVASLGRVTEALAIANVPLRDMAEHVVPRFGESFELLAPQVVKPLRAIKDDLGPIRMQMQSIALSGVDAFVDFASGAGGAISSFVKRALTDLAKLAAKMLVIRGIMSFLPGVGSFLGFGGGGEGGKFAGFFASGGHIPRGSFGVAGESGPERITRGATLVSGPATVTPMTGGGDAVFHLTFVTPDGRQVSDTQTFRSERGKALNRVIRLPVQVATGV